jgi:2-polyprenyl-6-methoxyphenol hydroxylase-like FAD-dependent oxidoreductase
MSRPTPIELPPQGSETDALVIGAGPAGTSLAIRLVRRGWRVTLIEQTRFPRQKVCGECLGPASLELLDEIGLGLKVTQCAGPPIRQVAWMAGERTIMAEMPACRGSRHAYGCAIGRDRLDLLLLEQARSQGVTVVQPAKVRRIAGSAGNFESLCEWRDEGPRRTDFRVKAAVVIDAHGSWERGPDCDTGVGNAEKDPQPRASDLLAFKATFEDTTFAPGVLPVLCLPGGYGGMVVSDRGRTTIACCIRRETLRQWRARSGSRSAGDVVEDYLRDSCRGVAVALRNARRTDAWHAVGPLRTGFHLQSPEGILRIGNAAAEAHPLIGEGICMALQSAAILGKLLENRPRELQAADIADVQHAYALASREKLAGRMRLAHLYARIAMQPFLAATAAVVMASFPRTLTAAAGLAGKALRGALEPSSREVVA